MGQSPKKYFNLKYKNPWGTLLLCMSIVAIWLLLWFSPWQARVQDLTWLRLGIALTVFMIPGMSLYDFLAGTNSTWGDRIPFGFVFSHLLIALLGFIGRIFHFSFELIKNLVMVLGIIFLLLNLYPIISRGFSLRVDWVTFKNIASFWSLGLITVFVILIVIRREFSDDDLSYLAFLNNTQHSTHLNFNDIFFGLAQPVSSRFWLMSAPVAQGFLADLGGMPGLVLLSGYYEPFLAVIAILGWYGLARALRLSHQAASIAVILQALFLLLLSEYLHPGAPFFHQLSADKATATFILVPVFIQSEIWLLRDTTRNNIALFLLSGLSLTFMHPIALAYASVVGGVLLILSVDRYNLRTRLAPLLVMIVTLLPQVILRFVGTRLGENVPYNLEAILTQSGIENMITLWRGTQFYGFNLHSLEMTFPYGTRFSVLDPLLSWAWLVVPWGAFLFAIRKWKQNETARYIISAFLLCALVGIPFTGWIVGYFLSAWALERALWLFPFGLSTVFLLRSIYDETGWGKRLGIWIKDVESKFRLPSLPLAVSTLVTSVIFLLFMREQSLPDFNNIESSIRRFADIARVGQYLDRHIQDQALVMGSEPLNDLIPGVSYKAKLITFRTSDYFNMALFSVSEIEQRITDRKMIFAETTSPELKLELLKKYDVRFIVLTPTDRPLFVDLIAKYPDSIKMEKVNRFFILQIKDQ